MPVSLVAVPKVLGDMLPPAVLPPIASMPGVFKPVPAPNCIEGSDSGVAEGAASAPAALSMGLAAEAACSAMFDMAVWLAPEAAASVPAVAALASDACPASPTAFSPGAAAPAAPPTPLNAPLI